MKPKGLREQSARRMFVLTSLRVEVLAARNALLSGSLTCFSPREGLLSKR